MLKFTILILFLPNFLYGQIDIKSYVKERLSIINSISPENSDDSDLKTIGDAIGESKVVFLGEQDHGDAPTFLAKTRVIKYLHEKKGFDVLAFESDFFGLTLGWDLLDKEEDSVQTFLKANVFPIWSYCDACKFLFHDYIPTASKINNPNPLSITGIDNQMYLSYSFINLFTKFDSVLRYYKLQITALPDYSNKIYPLITSLYTIREIGRIEDSSTYNKRNEALVQIEDQLSEKLGPSNYWVLICQNLISLNLQYKFRKTDYWQSHNVRDIQMAKNLEWLCENKYKNKKVIVWAANYHVSKYNAHYPEDFLNQSKTLGDIFTSSNKWKNNTYIIGFTSYKGEAGRLYQKKYTLPKPDNNGFETWIDEKINFCFVDFKKYNDLDSNNHVLFYMSGSVKGNALHTNHKAEWNRVFDGVFFIRNMYACNAIN